VYANELGNTRSLRSGDQLVCENGGKTARFILIVQHHDGNYAQVFFAGVALRDFALQVLQKTVCKAIERALAAGIFLVALAAVGTDELDFVLQAVNRIGSTSELKMRRKGERLQGFW
jgi:hypothetical protein